MFKEQRLTALNISQTNSPIRYNSRNAQANAQVQEGNANSANLVQQNETIMNQQNDLLAQRQAGTITSDEYTRQNTYLTEAQKRNEAALGNNINSTVDARNQLGVAGATYTNQAAGYQTTADSSGNIGRGDPVTITGSGAIEAGAIQRIKEQHPEWTDAQVQQQIQSQQSGIQSTMSNSGLGMNYDSKGVAIPGSEGQMGLNKSPSVQASADARAADEARISQIRGYKTIPVGTNKDGTTMYATVEDPAETARLQAEARSAADQKAAGDSTYAASLNNAQNGAGTNPGTAGAAIIDEDGTTSTDSTTTQTEGDHQHGAPTPPPNQDPPPEPSTFLAQLDALEQQYAGTAMAPLFEMYKQQYVELQAQGLRGTELIQKQNDLTTKWVTSQQSSMDAMKTAWEAMYDTIQTGQLASAARTYDQQTRLAQQQKDRDQILYDRAIRDQNIKNEEDRKNLLLNNGITGGWRSSMHTSRMIDAFKKAENTIADLTSDKIYNGDVWQNKLIDIEQTYHGNVTAAYDAHNMSLLQLQDKLDQRAQAIDKTIYDNDVKQLESINSLTDAWFKGVGEIAQNTTKTVIDIENNAVTAADKASDNLRQSQNDILAQEARHLTAWGDTNPAGWQAIQDQKVALGLTAYTAMPTLTQIDKQAKQQIQNMSSSLITDPKATVGGQNYGLLGVNSFSSTKYSADEVARGLTNLQTLLKTGQIPQAKQQILNNTRQGMGIGQQEQVYSQDNLINEIGYMRGEMSQFSPTYGSFWKSLVESGKPVAGLSKDANYVDFVAHVQRVLGEERHRLFGAALTGNENAQADSYLFNPATDTAETLLRKLNSLDEIARRSRATRYDEILGQGAYTTLTGEVIAPPSTGNMSPTSTTPTQQTQYERAKMLWSTPPPTSFNSPQSGGGNGSDTISSSTIGERKVTGSAPALTALQKADAEFFAATGQHIFVNSSYRSHEQQQQAYDRYLRGEISRAAPPGKSLHEKGIAFDITNWKEAEQYLIKYGFHPLPQNIRSSDPAHFSFGSIG